MTLQQQAEALWHASQDSANDPYERLPGEAPETDENVRSEGLKGLSVSGSNVLQPIKGEETEKAHRVTKWQDEYWMKRMADFRHEHAW
jgi:hypothetical protein